MFKKLRNNLLLINLIITSILITISFIIIYILISSSTNNSNLEKLNRNISLPNNTHHNFKDIDKSTLENLKDNNYQLENNFKIIIDENNEIIDILSLMDLEEEKYQELIKEIDLSIKQDKVTFNNETWLYKKEEIPERIKDENASYQIDFLNIEESETYLNNLAITLLISLLLILIIIFFISKYFANKAIKPIENMWKKQKQFIADATHELKTPLTIINANLDIIEMNKEKKITSQSKWFDYIKKQTTSMNKLINDLLKTAKIEETTIVKEKFNIKDLIDELSLSIESLSYERNIKYKTKVDNINMYTDKILLNQVLMILVDNALKYTNESGYININIYKDKKNTIIKVINSGVGIKEEDIDNIFDRFYKADKARTNNDNSFGLGLFIAKDIITKLHGKITVTSKPNKETIFTIKL